MCCGRGVSMAASNQFIAPSESLEATATTPTSTKKVRLPNYPMYKKVGAYYGNPVAVKSKVKEKTAIELLDEEESLDLLSED